MSGSLKFYFAWVGRDRCRLGARIGETTYSQEFPHDTRLGDALGIVRTATVRKATGLESFSDNPDQPEPQDPLL